MPEETELNTPPEGGDEVVGEQPATEIPLESGATGEPDTQTQVESETVSLEDHEKIIEEHKKLQGRLAFAERELRRKEREAQEPQKEPAPTKKTDTSRPKSSDFEDYDDFVLAAADWDNRQKLETRDAEVKKRTEQQRFAEQQAKVDRMVALEIAKDPDFTKKAYVPIGIEQLMVDSDQFIDLAIHFGKNPDVAHNLVSMNPVQAAREIGKLEAKLQNNVPPKTKTTAPAPTKTVGGNEVVKKGIEDMTTKEYIAYRNKQEFGESFRG